MSNRVRQPLQMSAADMGGDAAAARRRAAILLATASALLVLTGNLLLHPVALYGTETDLVGEYIPAAQELGRGVLHPDRFSTKGPGYPLFLALAAPLAAGDWFLAARVLNAVATGFVVWATYVFFSSLGSATALAVCLGLLVTPAFLLATFEAGTDLPALSLALGSSCFAFASSRRPRYFLAGLLAGLAVLTRSNYVSVPIAGLFVILVYDERRARWGRYLAGVLTPVLAWIGVHLIATGGLPHDSNYLNLAQAVYGAGQSREDFLTTAGLRFGSYADVLQLNPLLVVTTVVTNLATRWWLDGTRLLPLPLGLLGVIGTVWCWRRYRSWPVLAAHAISAYVLLAVVFYSPRFSLYLLPFYLSGLVLVLLPRSSGAPRERGHEGSRWRLAAGGVALVVLYATSAVISAAQLREVLSQTPFATRDVGQELRARREPHATVMARKPHIAFYAGMRYLPMPRAATLTDLVVEANRQGAQFVFVSEVETRLRPEYTVLTDSSLSLPGLRQVAYRRDRMGAAAAYAVSPPLADEAQQRREVAASLERGSAALSRERRIAIATELLWAGEYAHALRNLFAADSIGPPHADIAALESNAFHALGMYEEAARACLRSIELGGGTPAHYDQLGRIRFKQGKYDEAARSFRAALERAPGVAGPQYLLGLSEYRSGRYAAAARAFQACLASDPGSAGVRRLAAASLARSGRLDHALRMADAAGITSFADSLRRGKLPEF